MTAESLAGKRTAATRATPNDGTVTAESLARKRIAVTGTTPMTAS